MSFLSDENNAVSMAQTGATLEILSLVIENNFGPPKH